MIISKKSWHYRILKWNSPTHLLCKITASNGHVYETPEDFLKGEGRKPLSIPCGKLLPEIGTELPKMGLCEYCRTLFLTLFLQLPMMGIILVAVSPFILVFYCTFKIIDYFDDKLSVPKVPREPRTLLGKWWKAKKEKVCPILEWK